MKKKKLIIIGLGISGVSLAKEATKNNIDYLVLEQNKTFGGVWLNASNHSRLQTHKDFYQFDDFPMPNYYDDFPTKKQVMNYINSIIQKHKILENTHFNYNVGKIHYNKEKSLWFIDNKFCSEFLGVCCGYLTKPDTQLIDKELKDYTGNIIHSKDFNNLDKNQIKNKNILIVGNGASGCDILKNIEYEKINCNITMIYRSDKYFIDNND